MKKKSKIRVLCVDDEPHDRALIRHALEKEAEGFSIIEAADREMFEDCLAKGDFDIVISDFNILGFEGLDIVRGVKKRFPHVPVIVITGTGSEEIAVKSLKQGAEDYIIKTPRRIAKLPYIIRRVLNAKRTQEDLKEKEENIRAIVKNAADGILVLDRKNRILYANPAAEKLLGSSDGKGMDQSFPYPVKIDQTGEIDLPRRKGGAGTGFMMVTKTVWNGNSARIVSIMDITEKKQAEQALMESESRLAIKNQIAQIFLTTPDEQVYEEILNIILQITRSKYGNVGYIDEEGNWVCPSLRGHIWETLEVEGKNYIFRKEEWNGLWGRAMREKRTILQNEHLQVPEGHMPMYRALDVPVLYRGELIGNILISNKETDYDENDVSILESIVQYIAPILHARLRITSQEKERKKLEIQLFQAQKMEAIGRLAGGVAHDFNNMLSVILGYGQIILSQLDRLDPLYSKMEQIVMAGQRSAELTRQLLAFSRRQTLLPRVVDLNHLLKNLNKMLRRLIREDIELQLKLEEKLAPVLVDPGQFEQVLMNLAVNARDAMPHGGKLIIETHNVSLDEYYSRAHGEVVKPGEYIMVSVSDTGHGMDKETLSKIFEPFFTTKEKGVGTGLGLAIVYGIVKQSGGYIWAYSEPGHGTTFKIYLPQTKEKPKPEKPREVYDSATSKGEHILVVEDEEALRELTETVLVKLGYTVYVAANGGEALFLVEEKGFRPDLVITDVIMPGISGAALVKRLQKAIPKLKVLYMSGYTDSAIAHHGVLDPDLHYIQKPFTINDLAQKVREVLRE
ncbi:MAG: response regulator [Calditrichia bacterium]